MVCVALSYSHGVFLTVFLYIPAKSGSEKFENFKYNLLINYLFKHVMFKSQILWSCIIRNQVRESINWTRL